MTNDEILDAYAKAFEDGDPAAVRAFLAPGAVIWHNFDQVDRDIVASLGELDQMRERLTDRRFEIVERFALPDGIGARIVMRGTVRGTGASFASHQARFFRIRDGKIHRLEEYVAPVPR